jgi:hypothetical protein
VIDSISLTGPQSALILWTVRMACLLYVGALLFWRFGNPRHAALAWTAGLACYVAHVAAAFAFHHRWSHDAAYHETARQTAELFGVHWGGGLYFNYAFTLVWLGDVWWMWWNRASYAARPRWTSALIHGFMAFMFFNATVVFPSGWVRWAGAVLALLLLAAHASPKRR